jgi:non-homologous end joining protein Ku
MALIRRKIKSGRTGEIDEREPAPKKKGGVVVDLMPLLKKSLERSGHGKGERRARAKAAPNGAPRAAPARRQVR